MLQRFDRPLAVLRQQRPLVAAVVPDAGHMPHQLAQGHGPLFLRELRHVGLNLVVELQPAFLQQQADRGRRERRGGGADPEPRLRRDRPRVLEIRPAKAFGPHDVAANADRHRESRQVLLDETRAGDLPPLLHRAGPLWRRGRLRHGRHLLRVRVQRRRGGAAYTHSPIIAASSRPTAATAIPAHISVRLFDILPPRFVHCPRAARLSRDRGRAEEVFSVGEHHVSGL